MQTRGGRRLKMSRPSPQACACRNMKRIKHCDYITPKDWVADIAIETRRTAGEPRQPGRSEVRSGLCSREPGIPCRVAPLYAWIDLRACLGLSCSNKFTLMVYICKFQNFL